jgi:hypothetical protein
MVIGSVFAALFLGFLAGLLAFKTKSRWCPECGATTLAIEERRKVAGQ